MAKFVRRQAPPEGFEIIEPMLEALEAELRERVNEPHEGKRKTEALWPVHQINWQKSRYVYDMHYEFGAISKDVYDYCIRHKLVDGALIAKWKKPGYEKLCSTHTINPKNYKFGTVSICRVPRNKLPPGQTNIEDPTTGCQGCASGPGGKKNIFGNKYGQRLAAIQIARQKRKEQQQDQTKEESEHDVSSDEDNSEPETARAKIWGNEDEEELGQEGIEEEEGPDAKKQRAA
eukprot:430964_1